MAAAEWAGCKTYAKNCGIPTAKAELESADDLGFIAGREDWRRRQLNARPRLDARP